MIAHKRIRIASGKVEEGPLTYPRSGQYSNGEGWTDMRVVDVPTAAILRAELVTGKGKTVSGILADQVKQHGGNWICFNASYFAADGRLLGLTHRDGKAIYPDVAGKTEQRPHLYYKAGKWGIGRQDKPDGHTLAVSAIPTLSAGGKAIDPPRTAEVTPSDVLGTNSRMIAGIKADGTLGLILVDGRGTYDKGLTSKEAGIMAVHYGYPESANLDGGWSAELATNNRQLLDALEIDKVNKKRQYHVADMSQDYNERVVHHAIAIQIDPEKLFPTYIVDHIPTNTPNNRRPGHKLMPTTITIHNTANPSSAARNERSWLTNPANTATASYHIVLDDKETVETLPLNESAWHAEDGSGAASGNRTSIGIEICESGNYARTLERAVELVARMLKERGWGVDRLPVIMTGVVRFARASCTTAAVGRGGSILKSALPQHSIHRS
ncbi:putative N-acetylmuramoyl-L-alanine amidase [Paenibacillus agaridevorans]|uniref:N-acetylmuramoyl-L-alanine amidase n=1 Tax=Paenibacillus agaridevorans TaxID=171404 RepID=A0A2R5ESH3_9BACL|nr:N-acetylmuramoyl-L-alanine amidase [Paenibacillus agaridevorans]GBG06344.1 putative N-acetylmuramoyl-L-alanine amidase [Paenibacillus agaridevorans]